MGGNRVTALDIEAEIASEHYFTAREGVEGAVAAMSSNSEAQVLVDVDLAPLALVTFCVLVLRNGCKVVGINHGPVDPSGFDAEHGRKDAREEAIRQVWPLLGFRLRDRLHKMAEARAIEATIDAPAREGDPLVEWGNRPVVFKGEVGAMEGPKVYEARSTDCPHAAPHRYCAECVADPCPIGLGKR